MSKFNDTFSNKDIKNIFLKYNAMDKNHTIDRSTLFREIENIENGKDLLNDLKFHQVVRNSGNRYYFCEEAEKNKSYRIRLILLKVIPICIIVICIIVGIVLLILNSNNQLKSSEVNQQNGTSENTEWINSTVQDNAKTSTYDLKDFNMQIIIPDNMQMASDEEINYLIGEDSSDFYEFAIYNDNEIITCFVKDTDIDTVNAYWENVEKTYLSDSNYEIISDIVEETISDFTFTIFEAKSESYRELFFGLFEDGKFVSFQYTYPADSSDAKEFLSNIIKKID